MLAGIDYTIEEICKAINGTLLLNENTIPIYHLSPDSRKVIDPSHTIFWAIKSEQRDGSIFMEELFNKGVRNFVTQSDIDPQKFPGSNIILVNNSIDALQLLAAHRRKKLKRTHVIAITGSNGKTVVKDWLHFLLSKNFKTYKSPKSYNSQIGVALSILQILDNDEFAIIEAGISKPGEMQKLEKMIRPHTGIFTNVGAAHDEGFLNRQKKIFEKLFLFSKSKTLVFPSGYEIKSLLQKHFFGKKIKILEWGKDSNEPVKVAIRKKESGTTIQLKAHKKEYKFSIPFSDNASIENAVNCFCTLMAINAISDKTTNAFQHLFPVSMRMEMKAGKNNTILINDSYSNDLQSLSIALNFLKQQYKPAYSVIISDMVETGIAEEKLYLQISELLNKHKIDRLIGVGDTIRKYQHFFKKISAKNFYPDTSSLISDLKKLSFKEEAILVKGARVFEFEQIVSGLEMHMHQTALWINLSNLVNNIGVYRSLLKPHTKLMAMVKAFAYGSGSNEIASLLQFTKIDYLAVAYVDEGINLRSANITLPIMVMNSDALSFSTMIEYKLEPEIFSTNMLKSFIQYLYDHKIENYPVHLKIDTGMHRLGFEEKDLHSVLKILKGSNAIKVQSVFTHLASSDNPAADAFSAKQFTLFNKIANRITNTLKYKIDRHISNTSAISRFPEFQLDMVRLGIGMYGIDPNPEIKRRLKPVHQLKTVISQIRKVKAGESVGYGIKSVLKRDSVIATVGIGYADCYLRSLGNGRGKMLLHGKQVKTVGSVCMDMTMLDVTDIKNAGEGDEVLVFGDNLEIEKIAAWANTIPYEILSLIPQRVKRIYVEE